MKKVTCLCCTYGRPVLLGEAVKCFIDQDYDNKELIVLNDQVDVTLSIPNCPTNIKIINLPERFNSLGEKRNYIKALGSGDYFCIWDDDDLYTPWRISESVKALESNNCDIVKASRAIMTTHNMSPKIATNLFHSQACITKDYMNRCRYPKKSVGEDCDFEKGANVFTVEVGNSFWYIYRWGLNIHHLSGIVDDKVSWDKSLKYDPYKNLKGDVLVKPEFTKDHWAYIGKYFEIEASGVSTKEWKEKIKKCLDKDL